MDSSCEPMTEGAFRAISGVSSAQFALILAYRDHLMRWNKRVNLVGPSVLTHFWDRHVWDSAQLLHVEQSARVWADVGAGAGFPGLILAILLKGRKNAAVHLVESMAKRVGFLDIVSQDLELPTVIHHARAETLVAPRVEVVTARACAPLVRLMSFTRPFFEKGAKGLFLKGRGIEEELTAARQSWTFDADLLPSRSDPSGRLIRIERLARRVK